MSARNYNVNDIQKLAKQTIKNGVIELRDIRGTCKSWLTTGDKETGRTSRPDPLSRTHVLKVDYIDSMKSKNAAGIYERAYIPVNGLKRVVFIQDGQLCVDEEWVQNEFHTV